MATITKSSKISMNSNHSTNYFSLVKDGSFWHCNRFYILKDARDALLVVQFNIFERIYGYVTNCSIENYCKNIFSQKRIKALIASDELDLLSYNTHRNLVKKGRGRATMLRVDKEIEKEESLWLGCRLISIPPPREVPMQRKREDWWGLFAKNGAQGAELIPLIDQAIGEKRGSCLDIGCGFSQPALYLLRKGWTVICVDYAPKALSVFERAVAHNNPEWLREGKLSFVCANVEEYVCPRKVDLVIASSSLPYFNPRKIKNVMQNVHEALAINGRFVGRFFSSENTSIPFKYVQKEMGAWHVSNKDTVGYLLASHEFEVISCEGRMFRGPGSGTSIDFIAEKTEEKERGLINTSQIKAISASSYIQRCNTCKGISIVLLAVIAIYYAIFNSICKDSGTQL